MHRRTSALDAIATGCLRETGRFGLASEVTSTAKIPTRAPQTRPARARKASVQSLRDERARPVSPLLALRNLTTPD